MDEFSIRVVGWNEFKDDIAHVRELVFVREQGVPRTLEWDGLDANCIHVLARARNGSPIGTARMCDSGHIGRMSVLRPWRGRGVGSAMLRLLMDTAREKGVGRLVLNAQTSAVDFYAAHGFLAAGDEFLDAGIPHRRMWYALTTVGR